jgi:hypothetical protein
MSRADIVKIRNEQPSGEKLILREQLAAQVVAVMQAHFNRPNPDEMREILRCVEGQIKALEVG